MFGIGNVAQIGEDNCHGPRTGPKKKKEKKKQAVESKVWKDLFVWSRDYQTFQSK